MADLNSTDLTAIMARLREQGENDAIRVTLHAHQEMVDSVRTRCVSMNCSIQGCPGHYEQRAIVHTVKRGEDVLVFDGVPVEVCDVCSDTLLAPETIRHIEKLIQDHAEPRRQVPIYTYA